MHEGTSMSAPHVVGVAATLISEEEIPVFEICDRLKIMATEAVMNAGVNTTTKLLYNGSGF